MAADATTLRDGPAIGPGGALSLPAGDEAHLPPARRNSCGCAERTAALIALGGYGAVTVAPWRTALDARGK